MSDARKEVAKIDFEGRKWIKILRNRLCEKGELDEKDLSDAFNSINSDDEYRIAPKLPNEKESDESNKKLIYKLKNNKNVNGLKNDQTITLSPFFTLIYGQNGTGKTNYYKILKDAFHSDQAIRKNIFKNDTDRPSAKIDFINENELKKHQKGGNVNGFPNSLESIEWSLHQRQNRSIKFCDKRTLFKSLEEKETGWSVDKFKLGYYDKLQSGIERVELKLDQEIRSLENQIHQSIDQLLNGFSFGGEKGLKNSIANHKDSFEPLKEQLKDCIEVELPDNLEEKKKKLESKIGKQVTDLTESIDLVKQRISDLKRLSKEVKSKVDVLELADEIKNKVKKKRQLEENRDVSEFEKYDLLFSLSETSELSGKYLNLIKQIAETALQFGYKGYPESIDKCFYCNQELSEESQGLIKDIHNLVEGKYQERIDNLNSDLNSFLEEVKSVRQKSRKEWIEFEFKHVGELYRVSNKKKINGNTLVKEFFGDDSLKAVEKYITKGGDKLSSYKTKIKEGGYLQALIHNEISQSFSRKKGLSAELDEIEETREKANENLNKIKDKEFLNRSKNDLRGLIKKLTKILKYRQRKNEFKGYKYKVTRSNSDFKKKQIWQKYKDEFKDYLSKFAIEKPESIVLPINKSVPPILNKSVPPEQLIKGSLQKAAIS